MAHVLDDRADDGGAWAVRGTGASSGQCATFTGPDARVRAEAYARWLNAGRAFQRRRTDPGFKGRAGAGCGDAR
jgi:hypothetical protein